MTTIIYVNKAGKDTAGRIAKELEDARMLGYTDFRRRYSARLDQ